MRRAYIWPLLLALAIFAASGTSRLASPELGFNFSIDKVAHFLVFGLLATSVLRTPKLQSARLVDLLLAAGIAASYGAFDEMRQSLTPGRSVELADWIADTLGSFTAVFVYAKWSIYRNILEWQPRKRKKPSADNSHD